MKIAIANGTFQAAYLFDLFKKNGHKTVLINSSKDDAAYLLKTKHVKVFVGNPWSRHVLEDAGVGRCDLFISLCNADTDNFASCLLAKKIFGVSKVISLVKNPANVEIYRKLGIDSAVSSTYLLGQSILNESSMETIIKTLSLENDKIVLLEATILPKHKIAHHKIMDISFPKFASIAAIYRNYSVIIPNGQVELFPKDKLLIVCGKEDEEKVLAYVRDEA